MGFAGWGWLELPRVRDRQDRHTTGLEAGHGYQSHEQLVQNTHKTSRRNERAGSPHPRRVCDLDLDGSTDSDEGPCPMTSHQMAHGGMAGCGRAVAALICGGDRVWALATSLRQLDPWQTR